MRQVTEDANAEPSVSSPVRLPRETLFPALPGKRLALSIALFCLLLLAASACNKDTAKKADTSIDPCRPVNADARVVSEIPAQGPALDLPGGIAIRTVHLADDVEIHLRGAQPEGKSFALLVDFDRNGQVSPADMSYGVYLAKLCVQPLQDRNNLTACLNARSQAKVRIDAGEFIFTIPRRELAPPGADSAHFAVEEFSVRDQRARVLPCQPFQRVYGLKLPTAAAALPPPMAAPAAEATARSASEPAARSAANAGPRAEASVRDGRATPPVIHLFEASPGSIQAGASAELRWKVTGSARVIVNPGVGEVDSEGRHSVSPGSTTRYRLTAESRNGRAVSEALIAVGAAPGPVIQTFHADPASIELGATATLRWSVANATRVRIDPDLGMHGNSGSLSISPRQNTTYTLTAEGSGASVFNTSTVRVEPAPRPSISFAADSQRIFSGQGGTTLRWNVARANRVTIDPGIGTVGLAGSRPVNPSGTTRYLLRASGPGGSSEHEVTVAVMPPPQASGELIWTGEVHGLQLVTIDKDRSDVGELQGSLPGVLCLVQPLDPKRVSVASTPGPRNNYERLVLRVSGNGPVKVVVKWSLQ